MVVQATAISTNADKSASNPIPEQLQFAASLKKQKNFKSKKQFKAHNNFTQYVFSEASEKNKSFNPYHAINVPKETNLGGSKQKLFVDGNTLMLRNVPHKYTQSELLEEINQLGFAGTYDFFYLPMDTHHHTNVGYAFINFVHPASAMQCWSAMSNYKFKRWPSSKICAVCAAHLQGFEKNVAHFEKCAVSRAGNDEYRPAIFRDDDKAETQTLEIANVLFPDSSHGQTSADVPEANLYDKRHIWQPQLIPEPQMDSGLSFVDVLSELLRQKDIPHTGSTTMAQKNYSYMDAKSAARPKTVETDEEAQQEQCLTTESQDNISSCWKSPAKARVAFEIEYGEHDDAQKLKRFHSYAARFRCASQMKKVKMCKDLEEKLGKRLSSDRALSSKLLNQAVAWLAPPRSQAQYSSDDSTGSEMDDYARSVALSFDLQSKLRRALIKSLGCIDLHDNGTQQSLRISLQHLKQMILQFEREHQIGVKGALAGDEWHHIRKLICGNDVRIVPRQMDIPAWRLSSSLDSEDPEPSFEPDDNTPRTNHSHLGDCFGGADISA